MKPIPYGGMLWPALTQWGRGLSLLQLNEPNFDDPLGGVDGVCAGGKVGTGAGGGVCVGGNSEWNVNEILKN